LNGSVGILRVVKGDDARALHASVWGDVDIGTDDSASMSCDESASLSRILYLVSIEDGLTCLTEQVLEVLPADSVWKLK